MPVQWNNRPQGTECSGKTNNVSDCSIGERATSAQESGFVKETVQAGLVTSRYPPRHFGQPGLGLGRADALNRQDNKLLSGESGRTDVSTV